jgi:hypothetical protein
MRRWREVLVLGVVVASLALLIVGTVTAPRGPVANAGRAAATALVAAGTGFHVSSASSPSGGCPASGPLGGLNTAESVLVLVVIALAGIGAGIGIGRLWTSSGGGAGKVTHEPPDPALNPQPLPPGFRPPEPEPALNPQPLPPGFKPPGPSSGGDRPT